MEIQVSEQKYLDYTLYILVIYSKQSLFICLTKQYIELTKKFELN